MTALDTVWALYARTWIKTVRRPVVLTFSFAQPLMWMLLFGFLFERYQLDSLPPDIGYIDFLVPGVCGMTVMFGASQSGIGWIRDLQVGFLQRLLHTPQSHHAILIGKILADVSRLILQALVVLSLGMLLGAEVHTSASSLMVGLCILAAFAGAFSCLSCAIAFATRAQEAMAVFVHVINMPLLFTSTALVPSKQMPEWLAGVSKWNPLTTTVDAWRDAVLFAETPRSADLLLMMGYLAVAYMIAASLMRRCRDAS